MSETLRFDSGVVATALLIRFVGNDMVVAIRPVGSPTAKFEDCPQRLVLANWSNGLPRVENFSFADGTTLDLSGILDLVEVTDNRTVSVGDKTWTATMRSDGSWDALLTDALGLVSQRRMETSGLYWKRERRADGLFQLIATGTALADVIIGGSGPDQFSPGGGADSFDGGGGNDVVDYSASAAGVTVDLARTTVQFGGDAQGDILVSVESVRGSQLSDSIAGTEGANHLFGMGGADRLFGRGGNDTLDGLGGQDTLVGGAGNDRYVYDPLDQIDEKVGEGLDIVESSVTVLELADNVENITLIGTAAINAHGNSLDNNIRGNEANNVLRGGAGNDTLIGLAGADTLVGASGNDRYDGVASEDVIEEAADGGIDTISGFVTIMPDHVEILGQLDTRVLNVTGNAQDNVLNGNIASNQIFGMAGNDSLYGNGGNDTLSDQGSGGNDLFMGASGNDRIESAEGNDRFRLTSGSDLVYETSSNAQEVDTLEYTGSAAFRLSRVQNDLIFELINSLGALFAQTRIVEQFASPTLFYGIEQIQFRDGSIWNRSQIIANTWTYGTVAADALTGTEFDDNFEGGGGNDTITSGVGSDTFLYVSGHGNDVIDEQSGSTEEVDTLRFSNLNASDIRLHRAAEDLMIEVVSTGARIEIDEQFLSKAAFFGIERIQFANSPAWNRTDISANAWYHGTTGNDRITASRYDDNIDGGVGNDTLLGAEGDDLIVGGGGDDSLSGGLGSDTYVASLGTTRIDNWEGDTSSFDLVRLDYASHAEDVWLSRVGNDLSLVAGSNRVLVNSWYLQSATERVDAFRTADGQTLRQPQVDALVAAMAQFSSANGVAVGQRPAVPLSTDLRLAISSAWAG